MQIIVRLRELRKYHHLTQEELAKHLNISRQSLISLEQGRWLPSLPLALQLATFFNTPLEKVVTTSTNNKLSPPKAGPPWAEKEAVMPREINPWSPFRELRDMRDEIDRVFDQSLQTPFSGSGVFPAINIKQDEENLYLEAHLPGFSEDDIDIDVADEMVTISGKSEEQKSEDDKKTGYIHREYQHRSFSRTVSLPLAVVSDKATAKLASGILIVTLPKVQEEKPKTKRLKPTA